jgi:hypothetical protein
MLIGLFTGSPGWKKPSRKVTTKPQPKHSASLRGSACAFPTAGQKECSRRYAMDEPAQHGYSVADLSRRWKIGSDKIRAFLRRGELIGVNVAMNLCGRPQWRITPESVTLFEKRRTSAPPPKPERKRLRVEQEIDFYPD